MSLRIITDNHDAMKEIAGECAWNCCFFPAKGNTFIMDVLKTVLNTKHAVACVAQTCDLDTAQKMLSNMGLIGESILDGAMVTVDEYTKKARFKLPRTENMVNDFIKRCREHDLDQYLRDVATHSEQRNRSVKPKR